jgi:hypothetical protein
MEELDEYAFKDLREYLANVKATKKLGIYKNAITNTTLREPRLLYLLHKFQVPVPYTTILINAKKIPVGSYVVAFGNYTGGELVMDGVEYNIRHRPMIAGKTTQKPHKGKRWTLAFYTVPTTCTIDYEPVVVEGEWVIKSNNKYLKYTPTQRPVNESSEDEGPYNHSLTQAQNLMLRFREPGE